MLRDNLECEFCGRSIIGRFSDILLSAECDSCKADFKRSMDAGNVYLV